MSTPQKDLNVGASLAKDLIDPITQAERHLVDRDAKVRMYAGLVCGLVGVMHKSIGMHDTRFALGAALQTLQRLEKP